MSTKYYGEKITRGATVALLKLASHGVKSVVDMAFSLDRQNIRATPEQIRRRARYLKRLGLLAGNASEGYYITRAGLNRLENIRLKEVNVPQIWDGKWRLVLFDIPEDQRLLRNQVRDLIKNIQCIQLQQSVWAHPFDCTAQFEAIRREYGDAEDILILELVSADLSRRLLKKFRKIYPVTKF